MELRSPLDEIKKIIEDFQLDKVALVTAIVEIILNENIKRIERVGILECLKFKYLEGVKAFFK